MLQLVNVLIDDQLILPEQIAELLILSPQRFQLVLEAVDVILLPSISVLNRKCGAD